MSRSLRLLSLLIAFLSLCAETGAHTIITRTSDGEKVTLPQLVHAASASDVVLVGESHDEPYHHELQLDLLRSLHSSKLPLAIGLEMMQSDYQEALDAWTGGELAESAMQEIFEKNWTDWYLYRDIFVFARDKRIPMVALNVPLQIVRKVSQQGFGALTAEERKDLPAGTSCDLKNPQVAFLKKAFQSVPHHGRNGKMFSNFCEAQTVRNSGMAINATRYLGREPGRKLVVLTGIWHAVKYGIPDQLQRLGGKITCTVIIPETPYLNSGNAGSDEADYLVEL